MNHKEQIPKPEESLEELDMDATGSVDDFIKQLEEKEKDLHITADLTIEIEQSEYDPRNAPAFVPEAPAAAPSASQQPSVGAKTRIYELEQEVESLKKRLSGLREERNEVQDKSDRRLKDFENYKYRMDRERRGAFIDQISNLAAQMLPVLDNLERAIGSVAGLKGKKSDEFQQFYDGIGLVYHQVNEIFSNMGVQPIATVGEAFDPNFHEAVAIEEDSTEPPNTVTGEMLRGYRIGNRVIRHSMVKVTAGAAPVKKESAPEDSAPPIPAPEDALPDPADIFDLDENLPEKD
ncbi:MAG: nucleotide exchange factor GrpE [Chloracidobacterium sp.]|nr:nucleotide exchange factor GrpE [Chloracidobacterium sp.]